MTGQHSNANLQASPPTSSTKRPRTKMASSGDTVSKEKRPAKEAEQDDVSILNFRNRLFSDTSGGSIFDYAGGFMLAELFRILRTCVIWLHVVDTPVSCQVSGATRANRAVRRCPHCGKTCGQDNLKRHIISVHSQEKNHQCGACGKAFSRKDNLTTHDCKRYDFVSKQ